MGGAPYGAPAMDDFYRALEPFEDFADIADLGAYARVPDDWVVLISDVRGSTRAIAEGRYKEVNMMGAASITAVLNACPGLDLPYVFGGDGATILVPEAARDAAAGALVRLSGLSARSFGLELRVGGVPVRALSAEGAEIRVRKYALDAGNALAMLAGDGIDLAERWIKDDRPDNPWRFPPEAEPEDPDLEGLSCRWEPLAPRGGRMAAILVRPLGPPADAPAAIRDVLAAFSRILGTDASAYAPTAPETLRWRWPPRGLRAEALAVGGRARYWRTRAWITLESFLQSICEWLRIRLGPYDGDLHREELVRLTDYRKYDQTLRMVLDVSPAQVAALEAWLEEQWRARRLVYGVHLAGSALMTCLVFDLREHRHVHFVDAADGGFAVAARDFKRRLTEAAPVDASAP